MSKKKKTEGKRGPKPAGPLAPLVEAFGDYAALAEKTGISRRALQRYNSGESKPDRATAFYLAQLAKSVRLKAPFS